MTAMKCARCLLVVLPWCLSCRTFTRRDLRLMETTRSEVAQRYGTAPQAQSVVVRNGCRISLLRYHLSPLGWSTKDVRELCFWFHEDRLVGYRVALNREGAQPQIDETKVQEVREGVATRGDLLALFGEPTEELAYPMTRHKDERSVSYIRQDWKYPHRWHQVQRATFYLGPGDVVREKAYERETIDLEEKS